MVSIYALRAILSGLLALRSSEPYVTVGSSMMRETTHPGSTSALNKLTRNQHLSAKDRETGLRICP